MTTRNVFRTIARLEDEMVRATMPRTAAADPLPEFRPAARRTWRVPALAPLTFTMQEVARA